MTSMRTVTIVLTVFLAVAGSSAEVEHQATPLDALLDRYHDQLPAHEHGSSEHHHTSASAQVDTHVSHAEDAPVVAVQVDDATASATRAFTVTARQFSFSFNPSPFVVDQGDTVTLTIRNGDVQHGFFLERYAEDFDGIPGGGRTRTFVANQPGTFTYFCTISSCGTGHGAMFGTFTVNAPQNPAPSVTSFSPTSGPTTGGTNVTISGANFINGATVRFGTAASVGSAAFVSATQLIATTPSQLQGGVSIFVTNPDGQSGTSSGQYTYVAPVAGPTISSFSPTSGPSTGGTNVTISGTGFVDGATVRFGNTASIGSVTFISSTALTATSPAQTTAQSVPITVTNPDGQTVASTAQFVYTPPGPTITSVSPSSGSTAGGTNITINGNGFQTGATVLIGTAAATNVVVTSSSTITATTPVGPSDITSSAARDVRVTNPGGFSGTLPSGFTYTLPAPTITNISPASSSPAGGGTVTITGTGFTSALPTTVTFGGTAGTNVTVLSAVTLSVRVPEHAAGTVDVVVQVGSSSATASGAFRYENVVQVPRRRAVRS